MNAMARSRQGETDSPALRLVGDGEPSDADVVRALRRGEGWAKAAFFDRFAPQVERTLRRILGRERHEELADLVHEAFAQALASVDDLRDPDAVRGWVRAVAARVAYRTIRKRKARRWLYFWEPSALPHPPTTDTDPEIREALVRTYALLDRLPARQRVAFVLRYVEGAPLADVAEACDVSLATAKRVLGRASQRFVSAAERDPVLREWLEEGGRWRS